jgi:hypothetical protein
MCVHIMNFSKILRRSLIRIIVLGGQLNGKKNYEVGQWI